MTLVKRYRGRKTCYVCGATDVGPHHLIPRSEGGLPLRDNIVWLCEKHHNEVEGPSIGAKERVENARLDWLDQRRSKAKVAKAHLDFRPAEIPTEGLDRLSVLRQRRFQQGYLEPHDAKEYHFRLAKIDALNPLDVVCLWCYPELHSESLATRDHVTVSSALATVAAKAKNIINSHLKSLKS